MTSAGGWSGSRTGLGGRDDTFDATSFGSSESRETGARRRKIAGYLRAANELRQTYQQTYLQGLGGKQDRSLGDGRLPGTFPSDQDDDKNQLVIYPSYARIRGKQKPTSTLTRQASTGTNSFYDDDDATNGTWRQKWDEKEDARAVVDVDVRGWLFTPHTGPMNRKNRMWVSLARQLVGIPAPATGSPTNSRPGSRSSSPHGFRERIEAKAAKHEEEIVAKEAATLLKRGEREAAAAGEGAYSEQPPEGSGDTTSVYDDWSPRRSERVLASKDSHEFSASESGDFTASVMDRRSSWPEPAQMTPEELEVANGHLMTRLKPFMAYPLGNIPVSAFFFNDKKSRQLSVDTNPSGHFTIRAPLDFIPTHVRVLAAENLSTTEEVQLTGPTGVSLISDIDDTVKHSSIGSGAREIFRNVFIRDLIDLEIQGVKEWYTKLANMDVKFHYVSNSPWQLYPVLTDFFTEAALPPGSVHLKQYNGMLQGIFEPVAERKKGPLVKILKDFPERKFLLIGDSGEADLEVYTDIVLEHPGRVIGVFIRDVTSTVPHESFDTALGPLSLDTSLLPRFNSKTSPNGVGYDGFGREDDAQDPALRAAMKASLEHHENANSTSDAKGSRPPLPPRRKTEPATQPEKQEEDLIDLNFEEAGTEQANSSYSQKPKTRSTAPPAVPSKPNALSSSLSCGKTAPPLPRKPSSAVGSALQAQPSNSSTVEQSNDNKGESAKRARPQPPPQRRRAAGTGATTPKTAASSNAPGPASVFNTNMTTGSSHTHKETLRGPPKQETEEVPPPLPLRAKAAQLSASAAQYASNIYNSATSHYSHPPTSSASASAARSFPNLPSNAQSNQSTSSLNSMLSNHTQSQAAAGQQPMLSKKEELWKRRWARAKSILDDKGVMLRSWRTGEDVMQDATKLVTRESERFGASQK